MGEARGEEGDGLEGHEGEGCDEGGGVDDVGVCGEEEGGEGGEEGDAAAEEVDDEQGFDQAGDEVEE